MNKSESDIRLIEDYLPIEAISAEASREKSVRKGHISTLHLWWARRPLVACRAAVYGALVPASQFVPNGASDAKKKSLGRANAAKFVSELCTYPGPAKMVVEAQKHILTAHAKRLTDELAGAKNTGKRPAWAEEFRFAGDVVTYDDIVAGKAPRPRVLDLFAGGGAIPLEALRLGCEAFALDLNPVAHIIQLCTLVYPQKYGKPDLNARGMTGPKNEKWETTWGGLANEVRYWGNWVLDKVRAEIGDLYPPIPDPEAKEVDLDPDVQERMDFAKGPQMTLKAPAGYLTPVAYLWTRTVKCKNPSCGATVPLVRQTWLCKKDRRYVALKVVAPAGKRRVRFEVVERNTPAALGFDPEGFSKAGNATCPWCGAVADSDYVKVEGQQGRLGTQPMAVVCTREGRKGKVYITADDLPASLFPSDPDLSKRISALCTSTSVDPPDEPIANDAKNANFCTLYGLDRFAKLFTLRQTLSLMQFCATVREAYSTMIAANGPHCADIDRAKAVAVLLACNIDKQADRNSQLCVLFADGGRGIKNTFARQALPMTWDFAEGNPFNPTIASWPSCFREVLWNIDDLSTVAASGALVHRGSAMALPWPSGSLDAVITDPPYYDNVPYSNISDFFYVWLKRSVGPLFPEHFSTGSTPKKQEVVTDATRHGGNKQAAVRAYEDMMAQSLAEAFRVLKPGGALAVVYAHKTTLGWSTLVDAFRRAGFVVTEACNCLPPSSTIMTNRALPCRGTRKVRWPTMP